jgi:hypothetical protein
MAFDYSNIGLNNQLQATRSPATRTNFPSGYDFNSLYEVQTKSLRSSFLQVANMVKTTPLGSASGTIGNGNWVTLTSTFIPTIEGTVAALTVDRRLMGNPYVSVYEGTAIVGNNQIYPRLGSGIGANDYTIMSGYEDAVNHSVNEVYRLNVVNNAAGDVSLLFMVDWKYVENNLGHISNS